MKKPKRPAKPADFETELQALLESAPSPIAKIAGRLVRWLIAGNPDLAPVVRRGWRSVNFRHPKAGFVCGVFPLADHVLLVFEHGRLLDNTVGLLEGDHLKQVRFINFRPGGAIPFDEIGVLLTEAIALRT